MQRIKQPTGKTTRAAIYARVSTDDQTCENQIGELQATAERLGFDVVEIFQDTISGSKISRSGLDALRDRVAAGGVDVVLVWALDRLGRSLRDMVTVLDEFQANRVALMAPHQGIDTRLESPAARFQLAVIGAVAQFEREMISLRTKTALDARRKAGKRLGRPVIPENVQKDAEIFFRRFYDETGKPPSVRKLAEACNLSRGTAHRWMKEWEADA